MEYYPALWRFRNGYYPVMVMSDPVAGLVKCWVDRSLVKRVPLAELVGCEGESEAVLLIPTEPSRASHA